MNVDLFPDDALRSELVAGHIAKSRAEAGL